MIGIVLRNIRKTKGLTQKYISKNLNVAENTISNYETEASNPNFDMIYIRFFHFLFILGSCSLVLKKKLMKKEIDFLKILMVLN